MARFAVVTLAALLLSACGAEDLSGRPLEVADALGAADGELVRVRGLLYTDDGGMTFRLCSALAESFPPQCGEPSLVVESSVFEFADLARAGDVGWSERPVDLTGHLRGATLTLSDVAE